MKLFLYTFFALLFLQKTVAQDPAYPSSPASPQNIIAAEYFIDTDPGFGNATTISITAAANISNVAASINTTGLSNGVHRLFLRTFSAEGKWSITGLKEFTVDFNPAYPTAGNIQNIIKAEYFVDTDPGFGNATVIPVTPGIDLSNIPASINTTGLSNGIHRLLLRTQGADGKWSITAVKDFAVEFNPPYPTVAAPQNLVQCEYFVDTDPGFGNGTAITVTPAVDLGNVAATINTAGLSIGVHRVFIRTKSQEGHWSLTAIRDFIVDENPAYPPVQPAPGNLVYGEYFFDTDPGFGNGTSFSFSAAVDLSNINITADVNSLADGYHEFFIRTLDDWSITGYQTFLKGAVLPLHFLSFYAKNNERNVTLEWRTDNEINTSHFDVERSSDGRSFAGIGNVAALNRSGVQAYSFTDVQPLADKNFYRLKQVDINGKAEYSKVVLISRSKEIQMQVFPNPVTNLLTVIVPSLTASQTLTIINAKAQTVKQIVVKAGETNIEIEVSGLAPGNYFIKWQGKEKVIMKPFIKLE